MNEQVNLPTQATAPAFRHFAWGRWLLHRWPTALGIAIALSLLPF